RHRGALQPADGAVADRARRGEDQGLAREGRAAHAAGRAAAEDQADRLSKELVEYLARQLVAEPEAVRVEETEEDGALVLRLHVPADDLGKVIGRGGRIARSLRTVARAAAAQSDRRVLVEIVE